MFQLPPAFGYGVVGCLTLFAILKGGREERIATAGLVGDIALTQVLKAVNPPNIGRGFLAIDVILLLILVGLALRSAKAWPMVAASCLLLSVLTHVAVLVQPRIRIWTYWTTIIVWTYALMITIAVGIWNHWRAQRHLASAGRGAPAVDTRR